jgi:radical SAM protein with 4Fe4S-binding SPASM domain
MQLNETYDRLRAGFEGHVSSGAASAVTADRMRRAPLHINAGDGFVFVSLFGEVFPSGYLPVSAGNIRKTTLTDIYQNSELFQKLRNKEMLKGRCGLCEYRYVCGGSRSRAYAVTGDYLAEEPFCIYQPGSFPFTDGIPELQAIS